MFRTEAGQARYYAAYDATLALWPRPVTAQTVETPFGPTYVNCCGPEGAPALLLLPGQAVSATMWYANVGALGEAFRIYAPDILGDMGKSVVTRRLTQPADFAAWLTALLDGLGVADANVAGLSYGGFIALRLALSAPERVRRLALLAPASLLPLRPQFFVRMAGMVLPDRLLPPGGKQRLLLGVASETAAPMIKQLLTPNDFRYSMYLPPVVSDAELRTLRPPTLLLLGEQEVIYDRQAAVRRATALMPNVEAAVIPNAGHALNLDQPELVNAKLLAFFQAAG